MRKADLPIPEIVTGQRVTDAVVARAKSMRRDMTPAERILWQNLKANRLDGRHFRAQQIIGGYYADFYCHAAGLVIEIDGPIHQQQREADAWREQSLVNRGLAVLRFTNNDVTERLEWVLAQIAACCRERCGDEPAR